MTYSAGNTIVASDYNGFVSNNSNNVNSWWGTGSDSAGWGQTALAQVAPGDKIFASNWANLVNAISAAASHTGTSITARTAPVPGDTVTVMPAIDTDIASVYDNRGNATAAGSPNVTWSGTAAVTAATGTGNENWTITWTSTVTFGNSDQARYFFNAGGLIKIRMGKSSTGTTKDSYWNSLVGSAGTIYISGGVNGTQTIDGTAYTGVTVLGSVGSYTSNTSAGWYYLLANGSTQIYQKTQTSAPYTDDYIRITAEITDAGRQLTLTTVWNSTNSAAIPNNSISGGTATASPFVSFGTAPATVVSTVYPSTAYLTNSWGTNSIAESVAVSTSPGPVSVEYLVVGAGGGGGGGGGGFYDLGYPYTGGGGAGGQVVTGTFASSGATSYSVTIGAGGAGSYAGRGSPGSSTVFGSYTAAGGGGGGSGAADSTSNSLSAYNTGGVPPGYTPGTPTGGYSGAASGYGSFSGGGAGAAGNGGSGAGPSPGCGGGTSGAGGVGVSSSISGTPVVYAGGSAGGWWAAPGNICGGPSYSSPGSGGYGGGWGPNTPNTGQSGYNGIVIVKYASATALFVGGTITASGGYITHTFTTSGTLTPISEYWAINITNSSGSSSVSTTRGAVVDSQGNSYTYTYGYGASGNQFVLTKRNSYGGVLWSKISVYGSYVSLIFYSKIMDIDSSGNLYCVAATTYAGNSAIWVAKINSSGTIVWQNALYNPDGVTPEAVTVDSSGNVYVAGYFVQPSAIYAGYLAKFNSSGTLVWQKTYNESPTKYVTFYGVVCDSSGNVYVTSTVSRNPSASPAGVMKLDSSGNILWQTGLIINTTDYTAFKGIALDDSGNIGLCGYSNQAGGAWSFLSAKLNSSGTLQWSKYAINSIANAGDFGEDCEFDSSGNLYTYGYMQAISSPPLSKSRSQIFKYNSSGTLQFQRAFRYTDNTKHTDGVRIVIDEVNIPTMFVAGADGNNNQGFIAKLPADGTLTGTYGIWEYSISSYTDSGSGATVVTTTLSASSASCGVVNLGITLSDTALSLDAVTAIP